MKFDELLAEYLYETKTLHLEGIGTFTLDGKVSVPNESDKGIYYPIDGLNFKHRPREGTDEALIAFLVKKLGKIQPLVRSDLESYLSNVKQFINLGKPYTIEGIGTLHINNQGTYEFTPGNFLPVKEELNPKRENPEHNYPQKGQNSAGGKLLLIALVVLISLAALAAMGWGVYTLVVNNKPAEEEVSLSADSLQTQNPLVDTINDASVKPVGDSIASTGNTGDTAQYKMIFEITPEKQRAISRSSKLQISKINAGYDSVGDGNNRRYRIFVTKRLSAADTVKVRDSVARFFMKKVVVERQQ